MNIKLTLFGLLLITAPFCATIQADQRVLGYSYQADSILPQGKWEVENWITHKSDNSWNLRQELEYGLTPKLTTALYLNSKLTSETFTLQGLSSEWKYMVVSPHVKPVGFMLYGEIGFSGDEIETEEKFIFQHNRGNWIFLTNLIFEQEFEENETENVVELTGGASYKLNQNWYLGFDAKVESVYEGFFEEHEGNAAYAGPTVHYETSKWYVTGTLLSRLSENLSLYEETEVRVLTGYFF